MKLFQSSWKAKRIKWLEKQIAYLNREIDEMTQERDSWIAQAADLEAQLQRRDATIYVFRPRDPEV